MGSRYDIILLIAYFFLTDVATNQLDVHGNGKIIQRSSRNTILDWLPKLPNPVQQLVVKILPDSKLIEATENSVKIPTVSQTTRRPVPERVVKTMEVLQSEEDSSKSSSSSSSEEQEDEDVEKLLLGRSTVAPMHPPPTEKVEYVWVVTKKPKKFLHRRQSKTDNTTSSKTKDDDDVGWGGGSGVEKVPTISSNTSSGTESRKGSASKGKPYNVRLIRPNEMVGPQGLNFFQFKRYSSIGRLWIKKFLAGRGDFVGEGVGVDVDVETDNWEHRRYDRACLYEEYKFKRQSMTVQDITQDIKLEVDRQNQLLGFKWLNWHFKKWEKPLQVATGDKGTEHPRYRTFQFLNTTMTIFRDKTCRNASSYAAGSYMFAPVGEGARANELGVDKKILPVDFVNELFGLFIQLREMTLSKDETDYPSTLDEEEILKGILADCHKEEPPIEWFSHSCADQILSVDESNNFACVIMEQYGFNPLISDPILDSMWQMFNSVYAYCFKYFQTNLMLWHRYAMIMANAYTIQMRKRWLASTPPKNFYRRLLGPDYEVHLETIQRCMFGSALRSNIPVLLPRFTVPESTRYGIAGYKDRV